MKIKLLRDSRINHLAGEIVEVSPEQGGFLLSVGSAELVELKKAPKVETAAIPVDEVAEKAVKAPKAAPKTTTKKVAKK